MWWDFKIEVPSHDSESNLKNEQMESTNFLHVDTDSQKLKADQNFFGWVKSKMDMASLVMGL